MILENNGTADGAQILYKNAAARSNHDRRENAEPKPQTHIVHRLPFALPFALAGAFFFGLSESSESWPRPASCRFLSSMKRED